MEKLKKRFVQQSGVYRADALHYLVAGNVNLALVRQALGHRSIRSTMAYVGTSDQQVAEALQKALMGLF